MASLYFSYGTMFVGCIDGFLTEEVFVFRIDRCLFWLVINGVFSWLAQLLFNQAIKLDSPANVMLFSGLSVLTSIAGDRIMLGIEINLLKVVGGVVFLSALKLLGSARG